MNDCLQLLEEVKETKRQKEEEELMRRAMKEKEYIDNMDFYEAREAL